MVLPAIYRQAGFQRKPAVLMRSVNGRDWHPPGGTAALFQFLSLDPHPELVEGCSSLVPDSASFDKLRMM